ncbi:MAG: sulfotransferase [Metallibacterium scheffleri]|jgi:Flp pilus assembly protein TadD|uniref:tetratricopeptide repeat-containing sulfotransferase family protein n=1 Tax=Metallibacterium scheffleri TaxID=993689 RepID=UPI0026EEF51A|nr:tetratricopeptide repeat-containing sulfotransferase family protein [Metallibacterium scheffleri]MCK9367704.1 sulfotransferase [Metallibacterium scheffleri]
MDQAAFEALEQAMRSGHWSDAEQGARRILESATDDVRAIVTLAVSLGMQGRLNEALSLYRQLTALQPHEPAHFCNLATALRAAGELDEAAVAYQQAQVLSPHDASVLANLGLLRWQQGDVIETRAIMLEASQCAPDAAEPRIYGALACHACAEDDEARRLLSGSERWPPLEESLEADLATALIQIERIEVAELRLQQLLGRKPDSARARVQLAALYERLSRIAEAENMLAAVAPEAWGDEAFAVRAALLLRAGQAHEARLAYEALVERVGATAANAPFYFALAKACDRLGDAASAMRALEAGHRAQRHTAARLVPDLVDAASDPLPITQQRVTHTDRASWQAIAAPDVQASPIFVVGFPRSGTTLLEQMLDAHPALCSMDEQGFFQDVIEGMQRMGWTYPHDLGRLDSEACATLRAIYWAKVATVVALKDGVRLVDKNPLNILRLPMMQRIFPNASVILALRHPMDVVLSCYMQSFRAPAFQMLCSSLDRLARGYANALRFWLDQSDVLQPHAMQLRYEDLVEDPVRIARALGDFLGLEDVSALLQFDTHARAKGFISTPSYAQVVEPLNKRAVERWQRYRPWLEPLRTELAPFCQRFGYSLD